MMFSQSNAIASSLAPLDDPHLATTENESIELSLLPYPVLIGEHLDQRINAFIRAQGKERVVVVCDANLIEYSEELASILPGKPEPLAFALGEKRKRLRTVELVLDTLAESGVDRTTVIVGIGGGVAGDLFGFAASCYMRGVPFINVATSLVAMVDASIGGKTGVDLRAGKNLAGAFCDPLAVFAPIETLQSLPKRELREGLGEVVKHAIIDGEAAFARLEALAAEPLPHWPWKEIVAESLRVKAAIVCEDRLESARREVLNLGHTFAHGIEYASDYRISHGAAVAIGLRGAGLLAQELQGFPAQGHRRVLTLLDALKLPLYNDTIEADEIIEGMASDKKARAGNLRFVLPRAIGAVNHGVTATKPQIRAAVKQILAPPKKREL